MKSFIPGQLIVSNEGTGGICHLVIKADPSPKWDGVWWITVLSAGADKPIGPIILSPALWKELKTDEILHSRSTHLPL